MVLLLRHIWKKSHFALFGSAFNVNDLCTNSLLLCRFIVSAPNVFRVPSEAAVHVLVEGANNVTVHVSLKGLGVEARSDLPNGKPVEPYHALLSSFSPIIIIMREKEYYCVIEVQIWTPPQQANDMNGSLHNNILQLILPMDVNELFEVIMASSSTSAKTLTNCTCRVMGRLQQQSLTIKSATYPLSWTCCW